MQDELNGKFSRPTRAPVVGQARGQGVEATTIPKKLEGDFVLGSIYLYRFRHISFLIYVGTIDNECAAVKKLFYQEDQAGCKKVLRPNNRLRCDHHQYNLEIDPSHVGPQDPFHGTDPEKEVLVTIDGIAPSGHIVEIPEELSPAFETIVWILRLNFDAIAMPPTRESAPTAYQSSPIRLRLNVGAIQDRVHARSTLSSMNPRTRG